MSSKKAKKSLSTRNLVLLGMLTAIVAVLQVAGAFIRFGPFSISLVLMPIVVGAALIGPYAGGWLGLVFGFAVLFSGDANVFLAISPAATFFLVLLKGTMAGICAGAVCKMFSLRSRTIAAVLAGAVCPIVNTGLFIVGAYLFFLPTIKAWGEAAGFSDAMAFIVVGMVGLNFLFELGLNLVLSPVVVRIVQYGQSRQEG